MTKPWQTKADRTTRMIRVDRSTVARLKALQQQCEESEGNYQYNTKDWHGRLVLSLSSVIELLLDRNEAHLERGRKRASRVSKDGAEGVIDPESGSK